MPESTIRPSARENVIQVAENVTPIDEYLYVDAIRINRVLIFYWYNITDEERYYEMSEITTLMYVYDEITKFFDIPDSYSVNNEVITIDKRSKDSIRGWVFTCVSETVELLKTGG